MSDVGEKYSVDGFRQVWELRGSNNKDRMADMYMSKAKGMLMSWPFEYGESISQEVSEGIVTYGDKLMENAIAEEDGDKEMDELNGIGDDFLSMEQSFVLLLKTANHQDDNEKRVRNMYPMPEEEQYIDSEKALSLREAFTAMKAFVSGKSKCAFSATIAFLGCFTDDGVVFEDGRVVPANIIIQEVKNAIQKKDPRDILPNVYDIVFLHGKEMKVFSINVSNGNMVGEVHEGVVSMTV